MSFNNISVWEIVLLISLGITFLVQMFYYLYYFLGVVLKTNKENKKANDTVSNRPPVSVIICARDEEDNLRKFLPLVLEQDYPDFEVIVVNDASEDDTQMVLNSFVRQYDNLYVTHTGIAKVISRKKNAINIGIKAAKNDLLLFTDADCYPLTKDWISLMVQAMTPDKEFVVGYGDYILDKGFTNRLITFDTLFIAIQYFGMAYRGTPYMAVGRNFMYRKSTYFNNRGFEGHLHLVSGDDDLFINKLGNADNTAIMVKKESKTMSVPEKKFSSWITQKRRHLTTSGLYTANSKIKLGLEALTRGLFYLTILLSVIYASPILLLFSGVLFVLRYIIQLFVINKSAKILGSRKFFLTIILFDIFLTITSFILLVRNKLKFNKYK